MTLIATAISQYGIVQAADPTLTNHPDHIVSDKRVFQVRSLNALISFTGGYEVAGQPLDRWAAAVINDYEETDAKPTLSGLAERLRDRLSRLRDPIHRRAIHIAGYVGNRAHAHAEVYYVRNVQGRAPDGGYGRPGRKFIVTEEFWGRDYQRHETRDTLRGGGARMYLDGFPEKRIAYMLLHERIHDFYRRVWASGSKMFRIPRSLDDIASLVELDMRVAAMFLATSGRRSHRHGGSLQLETLPTPANAPRSA